MLGCDKGSQKNKMKTTTFSPNSIMAALPKHMEDSASSFAHKFDGLDLCRSGAFQTDTQTITRNADTFEIEFESRNEYCQFQEHEFLNYRLKNITEKSKITTERVKSKDTVCQKKEVREMKVFLIERRPSTLPLRLVLAFWRRLKRLTHHAITANQTVTSAIENHKASRIQDKKEANELEEVDGITSSSKADALTESLVKNLPFSKGDGESILNASKLNVHEPPLKLGNQETTQRGRDFGRPTASNLSRKFFIPKIMSMKKKSVTDEQSVSKKI